MHRSAPGGVAPFTQILLDSCLRDVALAFVTDGSFGYDEQQILDAVEQIAAAGRKLHLHLYLYNGPAQRRWRSGFFHSFAIMNPIWFRSRIRSDTKFRKLFQNEVKKLIPILQRARELDVEVSLAPGLEDNLDNLGFRQSISLIRAALPRELLPKLVRSTCGDCSPGNQSGIPKGVVGEVHTSDVNFSTRNGFVSTDGEYFVLNHDRIAGDTKTLTLSDLVPSLRQAGRLQNQYLLWIPKFQDSTSDFSPTSPDSRTYRAPSAADSFEIINFLRTP